MLYSKNKWFLSLHIFARLSKNEKKPYLIMYRYDHFEKNFRIYARTFIILRNISPNPNFEFRIFFASFFCSRFLLDFNRIFFVCRVLVFFYTKNNSKFKLARLGKYTFHTNHRKESQLAIIKRFIQPWN